MKESEKIKEIEKAKEWKKKLIFFGVILALIALAFLLLFFWYKGQINDLNAQIAQEDEAKLKLHDTIQALQEDNELALKEKSDVQEALDNALATIDEYVAKERVVIDAEEFESKIQSISELATLEYQYTNVGVVDGKKQFSFWNQNIPFTGKTAVIVMDGKIKVGIDCAQADVKENKLKKEIVVVLPHSEILSNELDENSMQVVEDEQSIFNKLTEEDHNDLRKQIKEKAFENAKKSNVQEMADERAQLLIKDMIESFPNVKNNYDVTFEYLEE